MPQTPANESSGSLPEKPCPICGKPASPSSRPFCSERCRDVDLNRWLSGSYAIPARPEDDEDAE
ncbi:MAG: DNA gyrase inhibitor YacG [Proteobacteria bacterium]|nr:DNA gyrase inhibitor YacG [Pseudomonadota bacterium]